MTAHLILIKTSGRSRKWWNLISGDLREHPVFLPVLPAEWLENDLFSALSTHVTSLLLLGFRQLNVITSLSWKQLSALGKNTKTEHQNTEQILDLS